MIFQIGETVICSITVRDENGDLQDAATTMNIVIEQITPQFRSLISIPNELKYLSGSLESNISSPKPALKLVCLSAISFSGGRLAYPCTPDEN